MKIYCFHFAGVKKDKAKFQMNETCKSTFENRLPWIIILGVETVLIILGNTITIVVFWKRRSHLRKTFVVLINLTVADLMVGISTIESIISEIWWQSSPRCKVNWTKYFVLEGYFACASISFLVLVSLERLYAIVWPFRSRTTSTRTYMYAVGVVWLLSGIAPVLQLFSAAFTMVTVKVYTLCGSLYMSVCLIIVLCAYSVIWIFSKKKDTRLSENKHIRNKELAKTLFIVTLVSLITWLPFAVAFHLSFTLEDYSKIEIVPRCLQLANSFLNPIIYCFRMPMFRETFRTMSLPRKTTAGLKINRKAGYQTNVVVLAAFSKLNVFSSNDTL